MVVGTLEAYESARQLRDVGRGPVGPAGAGLTLIGFAASCAVYLALGWWLREDGRAIRSGLIAGVLSGAIGGTVRALLIADAVADIVARYAAVPDWFVPLTLLAFVLGASVVSAAGGAALAFAGVRLARASRATSGSAARSESDDRAKRGGEAQAAEAGRAERED